MPGFGQHIDTDFPLNNLSYGVFSLGGNEAHCGGAISEMILDVTAAVAAGLLPTSEVPVFDVPYWNEFMDFGGLRGRHFVMT